MFSNQEELYLNDGSVLTQVPNYEDYYVNVELGTVYSTRTGKLKKMKTYERPGLHNYVTVSIAGSSMGVHEVAMAAREGTWEWKYDGLEVNHINEEKNDNRAENLELVLHKDQYTDSVRKKMGDAKRGSKHWRTCLDEEKVIEIKQQYNCFVGKKMDFVRDMAEEYGVGESCIYSILYGNTWSHVQVN